uniref:twin-arginine translocase subunit TatC n=1 Tax=Bacteroides acidifaciens TaxID=85831 RepID=UPI00336BC81D
MANETNTQSFWEHLDVLRTAIMKIVAVAVVFGIAAFFFKEELFSIVLAPKEDEFITYRLLDRMAAWAGGTVEPFSVRLILLYSLRRRRVPVRDGCRL